MKIAVTYDNGNVFPHFGHSEAFKIYEVENDAVVSSDVVGTDGNGHEALAGYLADNDVDVLICGGIGSGAEEALTSVGIEIFSGAEGSADAAVAEFLAGRLESAGVNCDHHDHDHEHEEGGCGSSCGGGCGGCAGCGGAPQIIYDGKNSGKKVKTHYCGTLNDGSQFDSSYDRGEPLEFICGVGMMIPGFDKAVVDMEPGEVVEVHLSPEEAYGMPDPNAVFTTEQVSMPGSEELNVGDHVFLQNPYGQQFPVIVSAKDETTITFDGNHELAGQELNFRIELLSVE